MFLIADIDPTVTLDGIAISSVSGIIVATMFLVEVLKRLCRQMGAFNKIPVFIYATVIAAGLTFLANRVLKKDGQPLLPGDLWGLMWQTLVAALAASGFYTWLRHPEPVNTAGKLGDGGKNVVPLLLLGMLLAVSGCSANPEKILLREGMDQATRSIRAEHKEWVKMLTVDPTTGKNNRDLLPLLSPEAAQSRLNAHQEYEALVFEDRQRR